MKRKDEDRLMAERLNALRKDAADDAEFMRRLEGKLEILDAVRSDISKERIVNRRRILLSGFAGFCVGFIFALFIPELEPKLTMLFAELILKDYASIAALTTLWLAAAGLTVFGSLTTYRMTAGEMRVEKGEK